MAERPKRPARASSAPPILKRRSPSVSSLPPSAEQLAAMKPIPLDLGIYITPFPHHIVAIKGDLTRLKSLATGIQTYCIAVIPDSREMAELGSPPSLKSAWLRHKYFTDTADLKSHLRYFSRIFPALRLYVCDFIPVNITGWLFAAVDDKKAYENVISNRTRLLFSLEGFLRRDIPFYLSKLLQFFEVVEYPEPHGMFAGIAKGQLVHCCERIIESCDLILESERWKNLVYLADENMKEIKWYVGGLDRDPVTGYFLSPLRETGESAMPTRELHGEVLERLAKQNKTSQGTVEATVWGEGRQWGTEHQKEQDNWPSSNRHGIWGLHPWGASPEEAAILETRRQGQMSGPSDATNDPRRPIPRSAGIENTSGQETGNTVQAKKGLDNGEIARIADQWNSIRGLPGNMSRGIPGSELPDVLKGLNVNLHQLLGSIKTPGSEDIKTEEIAIDPGEPEPKGVDEDETELETSDPDETVPKKKDGDPVDAAESCGNETDVEPMDIDDKPWTPRATEETSSEPPMGWFSTTEYNMMEDLGENTSGRQTEKPSPKTTAKKKKRSSTDLESSNSEPRTPEPETASNDDPGTLSGTAMTPTGSEISIAHSFDRDRSESPYKKRKLRSNLKDIDEERKG
ncbi:hypothetical protein TWF718_009334 [Orbilia javanica]|uniref:Uncharacterized protein n=1 Tax=Orbilia javanica TaxID=47235 RepID=A0AAN8MPA1_9PEZI